MRILLIGPQGSGKSTQGKLLAEYLKIPYISTGDIFREIATQDTEEGREVKDILESGQLVNDEKTTELVKRRLGRPDLARGFILDGYPRTPEQLNLFDDMNLKFDKILYLKIPEEKVIERLMKRGRADDTPDGVKTRLDLYNNKTEVLLESLKGYGALVEIDGEGSVDEIGQKIKTALS